jgi:hypothetical protein
MIGGEKVGRPVISVPSSALLSNRESHVWKLHRSVTLVAEFPYLKLPMKAFPYKIWRGKA